MQGLVRHGRNTILPALLSPHAARTKVIIVLVAISGPKGVTYNRTRYEVYPEY